jgi:hypothetical protein
MKIGIQVLKFISDMSEKFTFRVQMMRFAHAGLICGQKLVLKNSCISRHI